MKLHLQEAMLRLALRGLGIRSTASDTVEVSLLFVSFKKLSGFRVISGFGERGCAMHAGTPRCCCCSRRSLPASSNRLTTGTAKLHVAFAISAAELAHWESWPEKRGVALKEKRPGNWEAGPFTFEIPTGI